MPGSSKDGDKIIIPKASPDDKKTEAIFKRVDAIQRRRNEFTVHVLLFIAVNISGVFLFRAAFFRFWPWLIILALWMVAILAHSLLLFYYEQRESRLQAELIRRRRVDDASIYNASPPVEEEAPAEPQTHEKNHTAS